LKFNRRYHFLAALQNRANHQQQQQQQTMNNTMTFQNIPQPQPAPVPINNPVQMPRFPVVQQQPRMTNPQGNVLNQMTRLREPQKFNSSKNYFLTFIRINSSLSKAPMNTLSYSQSPTTTTTTTVDLSQGYSSQQMTNPSQNDYSSLQPSMNLPRPRAPMPTSKSTINSIFLIISFDLDNYPQTTSNNSNDILHQLVAGNSSVPSPSTVNTNNSSTGDQCIFWIKKFSYAI
jgi:hypothetical protein